MQDSIMAGEGNSRYLKSVEDFLTRYPTYADFARALIEGTLPIDLNGINPEGWQVIGTALNKANLLQDDTAESLGLDSTAVPDDAFRLIAQSAAAKIVVPAAEAISKGEIVDIKNNKATKTKYYAPGTLDEAVSGGYNMKYFGGLYVAGASNFVGMAYHSVKSYSGEPVSYYFLRVGEPSGNHILYGDEYRRSESDEDSRGAGPIIPLDDNRLVYFTRENTVGLPNRVYINVYIMRNDFTEPTGGALVASYYPMRGAIVLSSSQILTFGEDTNASPDNNTQFYLLNIGASDEITVTELNRIGSPYNLLAALSPTRFLMWDIDDAVLKRGGLEENRVVTYTTENTTNCTDVTAAVAFSSSRVLVIDGGDSVVLLETTTGTINELERHQPFGEGASLRLVLVGDEEAAILGYNNSKLEVCKYSLSDGVQAKSTIFEGALDTYAIASMGGRPVVFYTETEESPTISNYMKLESQANEGIANNGASAGQLVTVYLDGNMKLEGKKRGDEITAYDGELVGYCYADDMVNVVGKWKRK